MTKETYYVKTLGEANHTGLVRFRESPLEYHSWITDGDDDQTECMREGLAFHMALHEPKRFSRTYVEVPSMPLRSEKDKIAFLEASASATGIDSLCPESVAVDLKKTSADDLRNLVASEAVRFGRQVLSSESLATLRGMVRSLSMPQHSEARGIIARGKKEVEFRWTDRVSGIRCKARLDSWDDELGILSDLKRTVGITARGFRREVLNRDYHYQLAFYRRALREAGADPRYCCFTCGSPTGPVHPWAVYDLPEEVLDTCDQQITGELCQLADCLANNNWPSLNSGKAKTLDIRPEYI